MPPLGGPGPRRVNVGAVRRRERNLTQLPRRAAVYVPPTPVQAHPRAYSPPATMRSDAASGGPRQAERAQRYRESRPYYKAYRQVWNQSPGVQRSERATRRAEQLSRVGGENTPPDVARRAKALRTLSNRLYEGELKRGPDVLSKEAYERYGSKLWGRAGKYYPRSQSEPKLTVDYGPERRGKQAWVFRDRPNVVHVAPETTRRFMGPKGTRGQAETVLLHEWAHTRQPKSLKNRSRPLTEGGAEALEQLLSRRLGLPYAPSPDSTYRRWAVQARRKGRPYVTQGQFR